ncbi:MAG: hypothetical protein N2112_02470 [Gemmataceae bacterium]|nr:hypothetical protein [Gemmataceae bacterium]
MGVSAAAAGLGSKFTFEGVEYELRPLTFGQMARISTWLEDRARAAIYRTAASGVSQEFLRGLQASFLEGVAAGKYEAGGSVFREADANGKLSRLILQLMLEPHPQCEEISYRIEADPAKFEEAVTLCQQINANPLAIRLRTLPAN